MKTPKFGDILVNGWASLSNPMRIGIFVRRTGDYYEFTDGKGKFWKTVGGRDSKFTYYSEEVSTLIKQAREFHNLSAKYTSEMLTGRARYFKEKAEQLEAQAEKLTNKSSMP